MTDNREYELIGCGISYEFVSPFIDAVGFLGACKLQFVNFHVPP